MAQSSRGGSSVWVLPSCIFLKIKVLCGHSCGENGSLVDFFCYQAINSNVSGTKLGTQCPWAILNSAIDPASCVSVAPPLPCWDPIAQRSAFSTPTRTRWLGRLKLPWVSAKKWKRGMVVLHLTKTFFKCFTTLCFFLLEIYTDW